MTNTKTCKRCGMEKPLEREHFRLSKNHKDGFRSECKECARMISKEYREKNKEKINSYQKEYRKINTEQTSQSSKKYRENNKGKVKEMRENWEFNNKEKRSQYHKEWYQANKKRKRQNERKLYLKSEKHRKYKLELCKIRNHRKRSVISDFTTSEWEICKTFFDNRCCYCGGDCDELQQEHFVPVAKGGAYTKANMIPACGSCNSSKNDSDFHDWYPKQKGYSEERKIKILNYLRIGSEDNGGSLQVHGRRNQ